MYNQNYYKKKKNIFLSLQSIRMNTKNINFDNKKVKKSVFYTDKTVFQVDNIDVSKILLSKKEPYGTKNA